MGFREQGRFLPGCSYSPQTQFKPGCRASPATEIRPGERRSLPTEFQKGGAAHNKLPLGSVTIRQRLEEPPRAFVKIAEPNTWRERAKVVWEEINGKRLPRGYVVHHLDRDSLNDSPQNLVALTRAQFADQVIEVAA